MASGRMHSPHPIPLYPPLGHKLQKLSKESGIFQSLGTINFVLFTKMQSQKEGWAHGPMPCKYAPDLHTTIFRAEIDLFDSFVGFGQWVSGSGRENSPASNSATK